MDVVTVLIVDDHTVAREGLRVMLESNERVRVVGEAADGLEALELVATLQPGVVLMDIRMPRLDGLEATRRIKADHPAVTVIVMTSYEGDALIIEAVRAGAAGYLLKDASREQIGQAISAVAAGGALIDAALLRQALSKALDQVGGQGGKDGLVEPLTEREQKVLQLLADGLSNKEIGAALGYAEVTVKKYVQVIFAKLHVSDRTQAAITALRLGLIH